MKYMKTHKKRLITELEEYGEENATLFVEALTESDVLILRKLHKMVKKLEES